MSPPAHPRRLLPPLSVPRHLCFPGRLNGKECGLRRGVLAEPAGGRSSPLFPGSREGTRTALSKRHSLRPDPALGGPRGGGEGPEVSVGLSRVEGRGSRTGVRLCGGSATWLMRIGMGAEVGAPRREEEGVGDNVLFV